MGIAYCKLPKTCEEAMAMVSQSARGRTLRAVMLAGMLSMLAALACMTLLASQSSGRVALEEFLVEPQQQQLWLGEHWYISGLEDDGKYMVPEAADPESSGNALFDFGSADGTPTDPDTRLPAGGKTEFWVPADGEVPGHFDIEAIRKNEDGVIPAWKRAQYYDDTYPKYTEQYGMTYGPEVKVKNGHVTRIKDSVQQFAVPGPMGAKYDQTGLPNYVPI